MIKQLTQQVSYQVADVFVGRYMIDVEVVSNTAVVQASAARLHAEHCLCIEQ